MSVIVKSVLKGSKAFKKGMRDGDILVSIDNNEIADVLDYRFYQNNEKITIEFINSKGKTKIKKIKKGEYEELGLLFDTYLMDKQHSCKNKCIFCFIDQLPEGLRDSLYFKDDDSRLSFLFGNYITLTGISEHEVSRIIKMHISPINVSVHTTNPELRVKMMKNRFAGESLDLLNRFNEAGIKLNCQLVVCPDFNDKEELKRSISDLLALGNVESIAVVPVGLTKFRENLEKISSFDKKGAYDTIKIVEEFQKMSYNKYSAKKVYAADEFYILAEMPLPDAEFYEDFPQLENGVGLVSLLLDESKKALSECEVKVSKERKVTLITGEAAYPFICEIAKNIEKKYPSISASVKAIKNNFFGGEITVAGLVTATDIIEQLKGSDLGDEVLIPSVMLRDGGDMFLDSITVEELEEKLGAKISAVANDGYELLYKILGEEF